MNEMNENSGMETRQQNEDHVIRHGAYDHNNENRRANVAFVSMPIVHHKRRQLYLSYVCVCAC